MVVTLMTARESVPSAMSSRTSRPASTWSPASFMLVTSPTGMPATVIGLPACRAAACRNCAV